QQAEAPPLGSGAVSGAGPLAVLPVEGRRGAADVLDEAVRRCPPDARLHHERGLLRESLGDYAGAREDLERAVALATASGTEGTLADDLAGLGRLYHRDRQHEK